MNRTACAASNTPTEVAQDARHPAQSATCAVARHNVDGKQLKVRFDVPDREFSSVYLKSPEGNFASLNAGDYELYVGGLAINKAFGEAVHAGFEFTELALHPWPRQEKIMLGMHKRSS